MRTFASVTDLQCECSYLENCSGDPEIPIEFDAETSRFHYSYEGRIFVIYHCPFCGGMVPKSRSVNIPDDERKRLQELVSGITTIHDAVSRLGQPDSEEIVTTESSACDGATQIRRIGFRKLSTTGDVWLVEHTDGSVSWHLRGKRINPNSA